MAQSVVTVFGGSGFIGRHVVQRLAAGGAVIRVAARDREAAQILLPMGDPGQIVPLAADITDADTVAAVIDGSDAVVNLVGILAEWGRRTFQRIHVDGAATVATAAAAAGVKHMVQMSAIGADKDSASAYGRTKAAGEEAVRAAFPEATVLRPSVVFGPEDKFFNMFASMARLTPALPVFGCPPVPKIKLFGPHSMVELDLYGDGGTRFQPVYVGDVAAAVDAALTDPEAKGRTYELGGPRTYSFKEIMELVMAESGRQRLLLPIPFAIARMEAWFLEKMPSPLLTRDQVTLLEKDNVVAEGALTLADLGLTPTAAEAIVPTYLRRFRRRGRADQPPSS